MSTSNSQFLQNIFIYPVKSLGGISLNSCTPEKRGFPYDRRWLLVDSSNKFLTQRKIPEMALISVKIVEDGIELRHKAKNMGPLKVPVKDSITEWVPVQIWDDLITAPVMQDSAIDQWFSEALGMSVKLAYMNEQTRRPADPAYAPEEEVSFADSFPFLVTNQASLDDLNSRLSDPVPMNRFRPNLVIAGGAPFEEDNWKKIYIGATEFEVVKPCIRCILTTIDQETAQKGAEPLKTLATFRKEGNKIIFGQNLILKKAGVIKTGDKVVIEYRD